MKHWPWAVVVPLVAVAAVCAAEAPPLPPETAALHATPDAQYDLAVQVTGDERATLFFALQDATHGYRLTLNAEAAELARLGTPATLVARGERPYAATGKHTVIFRRREVNVYVIVDGRLVLSATDGVYSGGAAAVAKADAARVKVPDGGYQSVEDIFFHDDFMRTKDQQQLGVWRHVSGKWRFYSVLETNERADPRLSVNPFSLGLDSDGKTPAVVVTGYPFWCDYEYGASLRSRGRGWAGLVFAQRAADDYYLLRADLREQRLEPRRIELVRQKGTETVVLDSGAALLSADQWYRFGVRLRGGRIQCLLDGDVIFDRVDPEAAGGPVGLWAMGTGAETLFDDVHCETNLQWPMDRVASLQAPTVDSQGNWSLPATSAQRIGNDPGPRALHCSGGDDAWYAFGDAAGKGFRLDATVQAEQAGQVSLVFGHQSADNSWRVTWDSAQQKLSLARVVEGRLKPLGSVTDRLEPGQPHTVSLDLITEGRVQVRRDGMLRLRAAVKEAPVGRIGVGCRGTGAVFSDLVLRQYVPVDTEVPVDNNAFAADPFMLHWASSLADWFPVGEAAKDALKQQVYWHKGDFYNAFRLDLPAADNAAVLLCATEERWLPPSNEAVAATVHRLLAVPDKQYAGDGYALHIVKGDGPTRLYLLRQGVRVKDGTLPDGTDKIAIGHDGGVTWVEAGGKDVLVYHDHQPLTGPRVALRVKGNDVLFNVRCRREGIIDEVFEQAPVRWVQQGNWEITNRFSCTPTWSHMTALERGGLGALFHKDAFPGNVTVEYYAGMRMQTGYAMIYPRPGDFNCTFGAKPFDLGSGVSLLPGAWDSDWSSVWTRFVNGNKVIAETDRPLVPRTREDGGQRYIPVPYISAGRDVHGAWYYVKSRCVNGLLEGYFDNVKVLSTAAPKLTGDRVAVWTQENQIVVARVRLTYQHRQIPKRLLDGEPAAPLADESAAALITCAEAPGIAFNFDASLGGWSTRDRYRNVDLERGTDGGRQYLMVRNLLPGDSFEAVAPLGDRKAGQPETVELTSAALLQFDYRLPPETKVNLYLTLNGSRLVVPLTGIQDDSPVMPVLARPDKIVADGAWHNLRLPLGAALRRRFGKSPVMLSDVRFGNLQEGYLLAGFGGNPRGAWYAIDQLAIVPETIKDKPLNPTLTLIPRLGGTVPSVKTVRLALDQNPGTLPTAPATAPLKPPAGGLWYLHAQGQLEDGSLTNVAHQPVLVSDAAPPLKLATEDPVWDGGPIALALGDQAPVDLTFTVADKPLTWAQAVKVDAEQRRLLLDATAAHLVFADAAVVPMKVAATFATGQKTELAFQRVYSRTADHLAPLPPVVAGAGLQLTAEQGTSPYAATQPAQTALSVEADGPLGEQSRSTHIVSLVPAGSMGVTLCSGDFNIGRQPLLLFDYKMPPPLRADFALYFPSDYYSILFTDQSGAYLPIGSVANPQRDRTWHRGLFDLQKAVAAASEFEPGMYHLRQLSLADHGYSGAAPGAGWWLGDTRLVPQVSGRNGVKLSWTAEDAGGIAKYRYGLSADEKAAPTTELAGTVTALELKPTQDGLQWFSLQACDAAGNWSRVTRVALLVRNTPPAIGAPTPAPGPLGSSTLSFAIGGGSGAEADPETLRLTVGQQTVPVGPGEVDYVPGGGKLSWYWSWATKLFGGRVADGTALKMTVTGKDLAGNELAPAAWNYTVNFAADKQAPIAPDLTLPQQPLARATSCTHGLGHLGYTASGYRSARRRVLDPERNDFACQATTGGSGIPLWLGAVELAKTPYLSFDYKFTPGVVAHLLCYINGAYYAVALNGRSRSYTQIGEAPIAADGQWHTALVDIFSIARAALKTDALTLHYVFIDEYGSNGGVSYLVDNVAVFGPMPKANLQATWVNYDASGIQGAAVSLTPGLNGPAPDAVVADQTSATLQAPAPGVYLLQVRSKDGAGNLGAAARRVIVAQ